MFFVKLQNYVTVFSVYFYDAKQLVQLLSLCTFFSFQPQTGVKLDAKKLDGM